MKLFCFFHIIFITCFRVINIRANHRGHSCVTWPIAISTHGLVGLVNQIILILNLAWSNSHSSVGSRTVYLFGHISGTHSSRFWPLDFFRMHGTSARHVFRQLLHLLLFLLASFSWKTWIRQWWPQNLKWLAGWEVSNSLLFTHLLNDIFRYLVASWCPAKS